MLSSIKSYQRQATNAIIVLSFRQREIISVPKKHILFGFQYINRSHCKINNYVLFLLQTHWGLRVTYYILLQRIQEYTLRELHWLSYYHRFEHGLVHNRRDIRAHEPPPTPYGWFLKYTFSATTTQQSHCVLCISVIIIIAACRPRW